MSGGGMPGGGGPRKLILVVVVVIAAAVAGGALAIFGAWGSPAGTDGTSPANAGAGSAAPEPGAPAGQPPVDDSDGPARRPARGSDPEVAGRSDDYGSGGPGAGASAGGTALRVTGSLSGPVTDVSRVSCTPEAGGAYSWRLTGSVDGAPFTLTFDTNYFRGAGAYNTTGVTDEHGGYMNLEHGQGADAVTVGSNGTTTGTFTLAPGERSGSVDADLTDAPSGREVHVTGSWGCS